MPCVTSNSLEKENGPMLGQGLNKMGSDMSWIDQTSDHVIHSPY